MEKHRIGRRMPRGPSVPACAVEWDEQHGHVALRDDAGLSDAERETVLRHFAQPLRALDGGHDEARGIEYDKAVTYPPGTLGHYRVALHQLGAIGFTKLPQ